jgi:predicted oxidoreductase
MTLDADAIVVGAGLAGLVATVQWPVADRLFAGGGALGRLSGGAIRA